MLLNLLCCHIWDECVQLPVYHFQKCLILVLFFLKKMEPFIDQENYWILSTPK